MEGNKALSILAGIILGFFLGLWVYFMLGYMLVSGPIQSTFIPSDLRMAFFINALIFGATPGAFVGFIAGLVIPFHLPRGHMAKSIGALFWIPITALALITNWSKCACYEWRENSIDSCNDLYFLSFNNPYQW